ncbi:MAG: zinc metallopeptidase [Gammaproteobacteria bacterium]|nr:zinc metallopeptidase [Gammaproteobacteria bacterium]
MRWKSGRRSGNVEDRRGTRVSRRAVGGGVGTLVLVLVALYLGVDPRLVLQGIPDNEGGYATGTAPVPPGQEELADFVSVVLADTEDTWQALFRARGGVYEEPRLVLFTDAVESACGFAQAAAGPFYCPRDHRVYIDLGFYRELRDRFRAPGDFAQAYVIAHEVGHHVQTLLGISGQVQAARGRLGPKEANALSVRLELQADCFAGLWAHHADRARNILERGDLEEALNAASAIGDDRLQRQARGTANPDSFTHGSSAQRTRWFRIGLESGALERCDTFAAKTP